MFKRINSLDEFKLEELLNRFHCAIGALKGAELTCHLEKGGKEKVAQRTVELQVVSNDGCYEYLFY